MGLLNWLFTLGNKAPTGYWNDIENRRKFFLQVAQDMGFDPHDVKNWEKVSTAHIIARKVKKS